MKRILLVVLPAVVTAMACSSTDTTPSGGAPTDDAGDTDAGTEAGAVGGQCSAAREASLKPIDKVSGGEVSFVSEDANSKLIYVDASAGGSQNASRNPAIYINLETLTRVEVTDVDSLLSTAWDLSLKRTIIYTNSGDGGPGTGGAVRVAKPFDSVTVATGEMQTEKFFDEECNVLLDQANFLTTTFSPDWYDYDQTAPIPVSPKPDVTYVVSGGTGKQYKVAIESYKGKPDGTETSPSGGYFLLRVAPL